MENESTARHTGVVVIVTTVVVTNIKMTSHSRRRRVRSHHREMINECECRTKMFTSLVDKVARDVDDQGDKYEDGHNDADDDESARLVWWLGRQRRISRRSSGRSYFYCSSVYRRERQCTTPHNATDKFVSERLFNSFSSLHIFGFDLSLSLSFNVSPLLPLI